MCSIYNSCDLHNYFVICCYMSEGSSEEQPCKSDQWLRGFTFTHDDAIPYVWKELKKVVVVNSFVSVKIVKIWWENGTAALSLLHHIQNILSGVKVCLAVLYPVFSTQFLILWFASDPSGLFFNKVCTISWHLDGMFMTWFGWIHTEVLYKSSLFNCVFTVLFTASGF